MLLEGKKRGVYNFEWTGHSGAVEVPETNESYHTLSYFRSGVRAAGTLPDWWLKVCSMY